jgi:hypothetical protein
MLGVRRRPAIAGQEHFMPQFQTLKHLLSNPSNRLKIHTVLGCNARG